MKKYLAYFTVALIMAIVCVGFTSCGGSDNDDAVTPAPTPTPTLTLVGTWKYNFGTQGGFLGKRWVTSFNLLLI